jgi:hypothetical protein
MEKSLEDIDGRLDCKVVVYEELCEKPSEVVQQLFDFCHLTFAAQTQRFLNESTSKATPRYYSVFKDPLESAYKWRKEMSHSDQKLVQQQLERSPLARFWPE